MKGLKGRCPFNINWVTLLKFTIKRFSMKLGKVRKVYFIRLRML